MCATITEPAIKARTDGVMASWPLWLALAVTALVTAVRMTGTVDSDVAWQLWIANRIHAGASLYRDIIEVNPPLWFWMALPVDRVAAFLHVRPEPVLADAIGILVALSLVATNRLIHHVSPVRRALLLGYGALMLAAMPWAHMGQREQIVLIASIPYAALIAARLERRRVSPFLAAAIGVGAALGFALKHYFLIVPALLELWLLFGLAREWRWRRPETFAILMTGAIYAAAILVWAGDFLTNIVPLVGLAYGMLGAPALRYLFGPFALAGLLILGVTLLTARLSARGSAPVAGALLVAATGFAAVYFIQAKGWTYHAIPLLGCSAFALTAMLTESLAPIRALRLGAPGLLALPLFLSVQDARHPGLPSPDLNDAISGLRPGASVAFLAVETAVPWSVTLQHGFRYPSRYMGDWMLNAIVRNEVRGNPDPRLAQLGRQIVAETVTDFTCTPPMRIIVSRPRTGEDGFDILPFFLRDRRFAELLSHYRARSRTSLETYQLASPLPRPAGPCRKGI